MKKLIIILLLLFATIANAGEILFDWDGEGVDSVYTLRLIRISLGIGINLGLNYKDYTSTGITSYIVTDICERFYPPATDEGRYGLLCKVGAYYKIDNKWVWQGWSKPVVLDIWGDLGNTCKDPTAPVLMYNLPYPTNPPK